MKEYLEILFIYNKVNNLKTKDESLINILKIKLKDSFEKEMKKRYDIR